MESGNVKKIFKQILEQREFMESGNQNAIINTLVLVIQKLVMRTKGTHGIRECSNFIQKKSLEQREFMESGNVTVPKNPYYMMLFLDFDCSNHFGMGHQQIKKFT